MLQAAQLDWHNHWLAPLIALAALAVALLLWAWTRPISLYLLALPQEPACTTCLALTPLAGGALGPLLLHFPGRCSNALV